MEGRIGKARGKTEDGRDQEGDERCDRGERASDPR
jgi:hypothetical protein